MPEMNFPDIPDEPETSYDPLPNGRYNVSVVNVAPHYKDDEERWQLQLAVTGGKYEGRKIWVWFYFNAKPFNQQCIKWACKAMGIDVSKPRKLEMTDILARNCSVDVKLNDRDTTRNVIDIASYGGWHAEGENVVEVEEEDIPF